MGGYPIMETMVLMVFSILYVFYVAVEMYVFQRSAEAWASQEDCTQPRQEAFFDAVDKMEVDSVNIEKVLYPEKFIEPVVSSIEGTQVEGLLSTVLSEVGATEDIADDDEIVPYGVEPVVEAMDNDDYITAADLHAAEYKVMEAVSGPITLFATVIGKEKDYLHLSDEERRLWVKVGKNAKYFGLNDHLVVRGEFIDGEFIVDNITPINVVSSDYEIPDEQRVV
jgi:hypothetical protein